MIDPSESNKNFRAEDLLLDQDSNLEQSESDIDGFNEIENLKFMQKQAQAFFEAITLLEFLN